MNRSTAPLFPSIPGSSLQRLLFLGLGIYFLDKAGVPPWVLGVSFFFLALRARLLPMMVRVIQASLPRGHLIDDRDSQRPNGIQKSNGGKPGQSRRADQ